ncbi:nucleotidyl transferase AbiEii/AbiGii toxin family protein [Collinsella sp. An268]|uniref:nucleotidyl transferase AbiEii/AbiGii toxin family protein n=1 Tax=Collinsella sp. An268 TaxID=1965612 RepID=UPI000B37BC5D|nr:nucleotidyl transferase AbiEii/AbiGii toxin family protein [Collinsella sp. An268]OUO64923.1 hypothetical protein B5F70_02385 [Collinsella sp. An268]
MRYRTPAALEMAVKAAAKASPLDTGRAMSAFYLHRLLCRVFSSEDSPFVLKGGMSMLARTIDARATRDIDLVSQEDTLLSAVEELTRLASLDLGDFIAFHFDRVEAIKSDDEYRCGMKVWFTPLFGSKTAQPISIDLVIDEVAGLKPERITPADRLDVEGLPVFDYSVCRAESALADKFLAIIETHNDKPSSRVKDLVDIIILAKTCTVDGELLAFEVAKEAAARKIKLPETFAIPEFWFQNYEQTYRRLAHQARLDQVAPDLSSAQQLARTLFAPALLPVHQHPTWNPHDMCWRNNHM